MQPVSNREEMCFGAKRFAEYIVEHTKGQNNTSVYSQDTCDNDVLYAIISGVKRLQSYTKADHLSMQRRRPIAQSLVVVVVVVFSSN